MAQSRRVQVTKTRGKKEEESTVEAYEASHHRQWDSVRLVIYRDIALPTPYTAKVKGIKQITMISLAQTEYY